MEQSNSVYKKQNSFVEIQHSKSLHDVLPRIKKLRADFDSIKLIPRQKNILKAALDEIFDEVHLESNVSPEARTG